MPIKFSNPWARQADGQTAGMNVQRSDLWTLNIAGAKGDNGSTLLSFLRENYSILFPGGHKYALYLSDLVGLDDQNSSYYARSVTWPEIQVNTELYYRDSSPLVLPAYDQATQAVQVLFYHEIPLTGRRSSIYTLLELWRALVRQGRDELGAVLTQDRMRLPYRFNIPVNFYKFDSEDVNFSAYVSSSYTFQNAWISNIQMQETSYDQGNQLQTLRATFQVENIIIEKPSDSAIAMESKLQQEVDSVALQRDQKNLGEAVRKQISDANPLNVNDRIIYRPNQVSNDTITS